MTEYELFYLIGESKESEMPRIKAEVKALIESEGGAYVGEEKMEKRKLAYMIRREVRGTYTAQRFTTVGKDGRDETEEGAGIVARMNRKLQLYKDVLRFLIVRAEGLRPLTTEEGTSQVVEEVAREAKAHSLTARKRTMKDAPIVTPSVLPEEKQEATEKKEDVSTEPATKKGKSASSAERTEEELDKKLEEVLHI